MDSLHTLMIFKEGEYSEEQVNSFKEKAGIILTDIYSQQLKELFEIRNPQLLHNKEAFDKGFLDFEKERTNNGEVLCGNWIHYPWSNVFLHTLSEEENRELRTNRNKNIINEAEQKQLEDFTIAIVGLSVGGNIATTLAYNGFPKNIKLADFDVLSTSNLNRVRAKLSDVGSSKISIINKQLYEIDPYINITNFEKGISKDNVADFLLGTKLVFEIIDDLELKILMRKEAKKLKIPVVTLTSIGDSVMVDIERYDTEPETKIFNGMVDEKTIEDILSGKFSKSEVNKYVLQIVGPENVPEKIKDSLKEIGKTLSGRPQLMSTVTVASGFATFIARKIALGQEVPSGRSIFKFEDLIKYG